MFLYKNGRLLPLDKSNDDQKVTFERKPFFASVMPVPPEEELRFDHRESSQRPPKSVVQYRVQAYRRLSYHTIRDESSLEVMRALPEIKVPISVHIRYFLPEELKCSQKEFNRIVTKTIERVCVFLGIDDIPMDVRAGKCSAGTDLILEEEAFLSIEMFERSLE